MTITDIIGRGKAFEPPFRVNEIITTVLSHNNREVVVPCWELIKVNGYDHIKHDDARLLLAQHICDLLNEEHCNENIKQVKIL